MLRTLVYFLVFIGCQVKLHGSELQLAGFYQGKDIYIRNPYVSNERSFCIQSVTLNGRTIISQPKVTSLKIDLSSFRTDELVKINIEHLDECLPDVLNPEDLVWKEEFTFLSVSANAEKIFWTVKNETKEGFFKIEYQNSGIWETVATVATKGGSGPIEYERMVSHPEKENLYRILYLEEGSEPVVSPTFDYVEIQEPISFSPKNVTDKITFSRKVFFEIFDEEGNQILKGEGLETNVAALSEGRYLLFLDGEKFSFYKF